jgi:capsular polysaccharide biosynthesis protein
MMVASGEWAEESDSSTPTVGEDSIVLRPATQLTDKVAKVFRSDFLFRVRRKALRWRKTGLRWLRGRFARAVYSLPRFAANNPRKRVTTSKVTFSEVDRFPSEDTGDDWYLALSPPERIRRLPSIGLDEMESEKFRASTQKYQAGETLEIPEIFLACIHWARLEGDSFLVSTRDNQILLESAIWKQEVLETSGILDTVWASRAKRLQGSYCLLSHPWAQAYYHWMFEILPKLSWLEKIGALEKVYFIVPHPLQPFHLETLRLAGVGQDRLISLDGLPAEVEKLFITELPAPTGNPSPRAAAWLRARFLPEAYLPPLPRQKLYITRRDAPTRRLLNEAEIIAYLEKRGFVCVCPGELSVAEQITLFSNAGVVVAPHGAALTNMVFAPPGATIVELFGDNYINGCYWALANVCGQRHAYLTAPTGTLDFSIPVHRLDMLLMKVLNEPVALQA